MKYLHLLVGGIAGFFLSLVLDFNDPSSLVLGFCALNLAILSGALAVWTPKEEACKSI